MSALGTFIQHCTENFNQANYVKKKKEKKRNKRYPDRKERNKTSICRGRDHVFRTS